MAKKYTVLETWIVNTTKPAESNSAEQTYERLEKQGGGKLPVIDLPQELRREEDFIDEARVRDYVAHLGSAQEVLDIGPGDGWPLLRIAPHFRAVTGVDPSAKRVEVIKANAEKLGLKNVSVKQGSCLELPFADKTFDGAVAATSIEETPDSYAALREVFRVLKPGGKLRVAFQSYDTRDRGFTEGMMLTETADSLGYHYFIKHRLPPWERNYLVKFAVTPETKEAFAKLADLVERLGGNPTANPEIGMQFLERNQEHIIGSSWYELEHFTSETMKETLEDVGFVNVRVTYSAATLARMCWPRVRDVELSDAQAQAVCAGLGDVAVGMDAPLHSGEPVIATRPA
jgi:ubiquinone/menaquinone biosynthesis C-methylase UbiE